MKDQITHNPSTVVVDSGCSGHYLKVPYNPNTMKLCATTYNVVLPNGQTLRATHTTSIPIPTLPPEATKAYIIPDLHKYSLISVGQLCQHGCIVTFTSTHLTISHNDKVLLTGDFNPQTCLYHTNMASAVTTTLENKQCANIIPPTNITKANLVNFYHKICFSPVKST